MEDLVSIIVPIYNTEAYLSECIDSILKQTYLNFELILVDDGSTDSSCQICQRYVETDNRVCLLHKKNGGLSDARNYGLDYARGKYVTFIDSDDYVEKVYIEVLFSALKKSDSDISIVSYRRINEKGDISFDIPIGMKPECWSGSEALELLFYQKIISISACAKMYDRTLFKNIRFISNKLYEDILTVPKLFANAKKIIYTNQVLLNYRIREGSITESAFCVKDREMLDNSLQIRDYVTEMNDENLNKAIQSYIFSKASTLLFLAERSKSKDADEVMKNCWDNIIATRKTVLFDRKSRIMNRCGALISFLGTRLYVFIYRKIR